MNKVKVFAPATVANVACGFDVLGFALNHPGDTLIAEKNSDNQLKISAIHNASNLPLDPKSNVITVAVQAMLDQLGSNQGITFELSKGVKAGSGIGSSAASSAAAVFAANELLGKPFTKKELFEVLNRTFTGNTIPTLPEPKEESISLTSLKEFIGEDTEQLNEIINSFQEQLEKFLSSIEGLFLEKKFQEIRLYAHKMKTSFGMFSISTEELVKIESTDDEDFVSNGITIFKPLLDQIEDILVKLKNVAL